MASRNQSGIHYGKLFIAFLAAILIGHQILSWLEPSTEDDRALEYAQLLAKDMNSGINSIDNTLGVINSNLKNEKSIKDLVDAGNWSSPTDTVVFHLVKIKTIPTSKVYNKALKIGALKEYNELLPDSVLSVILDYQELIESANVSVELNAELEQFIKEAGDENSRTNYYIKNEFSKTIAESLAKQTRAKKALESRNATLNTSLKEMNTYINTLKAAKED